MTRRPLAPAAALALALLAGSAEAAPVRVGSKRDTEGTILGELSAALLRASGVDAVYRRDLSGGTQVLWHALQQGDIDLYPEYTGTLSGELLRDERLTTVAALRELGPCGPGSRGHRAPRLQQQLWPGAARREGPGAGRHEDLAIATRHPGLRLGFSPTNSSTAPRASRG